MRRALPADKRRVHTAITMPPELLKQLRERATLDGTTVSRVASDAIAAYFEFELLAPTRPASLAHHRSELVDIIKNFVEALR